MRGIFQVYLSYLASGYCIRELSRLTSGNESVSCTTAQVSPDICILHQRQVRIKYNTGKSDTPNKLKGPRKGEYSSCYSYIRFRQPRQGARQSCGENQRHSGTGDNLKSDPLAGGGLGIKNREQSRTDDKQCKSPVVNRDITTVFG